MSSEAPDLDQAQPDEATRQKLLDTTGMLLEALGVDRLTTGVVAQCAGVTSTEFYQYFPDKYALLQELGERLLTALRDQVPLDVLQGEEQLIKALVQLLAVNRNTAGGAWVLRMLRALPQLSGLRSRSNNMLADILLEAELARNPAQDARLLLNRTRLAVGLGYAAMELVLDQPDLDEELVLRETARAIRALMT